MKIEYSAGGTPFIMVNGAKIILGKDKHIKFITVSAKVKSETVRTSTDLNFTRVPRGLKSLIGEDNIKKLKKAFQKHLVKGYLPQDVLVSIAQEIE